MLLAKLTLNISVLFHSSNTEYKFICCHPIIDSLTNVLFWKYFLKYYFFSVLFLGIWKDIEKNKNLAHENNGSGIIRDISDGKAYQEMLCDEGFLSKTAHNLTAIFNTDGVNLYSSSKIELWPIFLAINELSPAMRFARDNMLLVGIWQGKGKPPFRQYMNAFSQDMNRLYNNGVDVHFNNSTINVRLAVVCGILDLPAKAGVLNMTYFNGSEACITCEEPGVVVKQGKGNARCYPYRSKESRCQLRVHQEVTEQMQSGTDKKRIKGFKGMSGLATLQSYDVVKGTVPDYMHGILLGITKMLLNKWFSPSESRKRYFVVKHLKAISKRLQSIKPPNSIERLPRDLEHHYNHFKATELQAWLLYYAIPCLDGFLEEEYMRSLASFSEAVYILLGDKITQSALERADYLLDLFYSSFEELYGRGSCGLNVHNACVHLVAYVRLWGTIWSWSCFPFEDANAMLLQSVHGTGTVLKQVMRYNQAQACVRRKGLPQQKNKGWKITHEAVNCAVAGALKNVKPNELVELVLEKLSINNVDQIKKVDRITVNDKKFYSSLYSRMQRRVCSVVLYDSDKIGSITQFLLLSDNNFVYAIVKSFERVTDTTLLGLHAGKHLVSVKASTSIDVVPAEKLNDTLVYIKTDSQGEAFVVKMPNHHGHAVFK